MFNVQDRLNRRIFLKNSSSAIGAAALGSLLHDEASAASPTRIFPNFAPKAKRIIYLFQSGAPSQLDLFDPKPQMEKHRAEDLPASIRQGQRLTTMTSGQKAFPVAPSIFKFAQHGQGGVWLSELFPHLSTVADEMCVIRSMFTEAINHDPAITFCQTGSQLAGRPSIGSWLSYGLGSANRDLPAYVVMTSFGTGRREDQPLYDRLWGSGFLPTQHQGVRFRNAGDPVLYLSNPAGVDRPMRRQMLDEIAALNQRDFAAFGDPETATRISQYEMAFRMQMSVPDLVDTSKEPQHIIDSYGPEVKKPGTFAANCLLARRLAERGTRFIQLYHKDWDHHGGVKEGIALKAQEIDRACMALITDLKQRGMLDETLIVWAGEFGRTPMSQGGSGRDHHNKAMSVWLAGAGIQGGMVHGATDDLGYAAIDKITTVHDLHATMLHQLGINHDAFSFKFQGLDARLSGVEGAKVIKDILA
jgi:hypothetical protein